MVGGQVIAYLGGLHYWWPKMTGKMYSEFWGKISAMLVFVGFNLTFFPQFILGYLGMPRRYASYPEEMQVLNIFSTAGASVLAIGFTMPVVYFVHSLIWGKDASANPWMLPGLEWRTSSPPPTENFATTPVVTWEAYEFGEESGLDLEGVGNTELVNA
jgi:cytochrome c oxidase subunit 1